MTDTKKHCPDTGKAAGLPNVFIACEMIERERGFGKRPEGYVYVNSKENLQKFLAYLQQQKDSSRGECYCEAIVIELVQVSENFAEAITKHSEDTLRPWIWESNGKHSNIGIV